MYLLPRLAGPAFRLGRRHAQWLVTGLVAATGGGIEPRESPAPQTLRAASSRSA